MRASTTTPSKCPADRRGFTLAEAAIASLILAVGAAALLSASLSVRRQLSRNQARDDLHLYARKLMEELANYVTADSASAAGAPNGSWRHPADACASEALSSSCEHDVTSMLPAELRDPPVGARLTYTVTPVTFGEAPGQRTVRKVDVRMSWDLPSP